MKLVIGSNISAIEALSESSILDSVALV